MNNDQMSALETKEANILVVDDNPDNLRMLTKMLSERGYRVRPVADSSLALSSAEKEPPDLILLDILMPGVSGYEICTKLKANKKTSDIPVIFISALQETLDKVRGFLVGGVDYITKPFQAEEVLVRIETHLTLQNLQKHLRQNNALLQQQIAERKRVEKLLRESEKRYRSIFEHAPTGIFQTSLEGKCIAANRALARMLGYISGREVTTAVVDMAKQLFVEPQHWHDITDMIREIQETATVESRCRCKDGREIVVNLNIWAVRDEEGEVQYFEGFMEDITERKQMEQALADQKR